MAELLRRRASAARLVLFLLLAAWAAAPAAARDVFVLISGGGSPFDNNYSQFLQARGLVNFFLGNYRNDSVWIFFGAGNVEGQPPVLADVYRQTEREGVMTDSWFAGSLRQNRPARHEAILRALREEILPAVAGGGTLYLFVGDHGSRTEGRNAESIISLWGMRPDPAAGHGWSYADGEQLGVWELRRALTQGIGKGRVVFCMTQCHAGGFHYLAMPHELTPDPRWFTRLPSWAEAREQAAFAPAAGFTATDEFSLASGCNPDPDPANWAGYERYVPESLMGVDLLSLKHVRNGMASFAEAHAAAVLVDHTADKPYSTSEQYLERWAHLIETRLARDPHITTKVKKALAVYQAAADGARVRTSDPAFLERQKLFRGFAEDLCRQDPALRKLLLAGTRKQLETAGAPAREEELAAELPANNTPEQPARPRRSGGSAERRKLWNETVRPAWEAAVNAGLTASLPPGAVEFEKHLLANEERGTNYLAGNGRALEDEVYWESGYGDPKTVDEAKARDISLWAAERRAKILAWAKNSSDDTVRRAADRLMQRRGRRQNESEMEMDAHDHSEPGVIDEATAAARTLFYRRVLAAWQFLLALDERPALARIQELTVLERTPLPPPNLRASQ